MKKETGRHYKKVKWCDLDQESRQNMVNVFALLLKIDKRQNPDLYSNKKK